MKSFVDLYQSNSFATSIYIMCLYEYANDRIIKYPCEIDNRFDRDIGCTVNEEFCM